MNNIIYAILFTFLICLIFPGILNFYQALMIYIICIGLDLIIVELRNIRKALEELNNE